jgi:ABC-type dipeptide/oligopeptide/nickel transport system permease subunit
MIVIAIVIVIAVFAYSIVTDSSPNANRMIVELGAKKVGFTKTLLLIPQQQKRATVSLMRQCFFGKSDEYKYVPINGYSFSGHQLIVRHYIDEGMEDTFAYNVQDLLPIAQKSANVNEQQNYIVQHLFKVQKFILGTDRYGRDILSRLLIGSRVSVGVGLVAVLLSLSIGVLLGVLAGYFGSLIDNVVMFIVNMFWSVPTLLLVFAITLTIGKGFWEIFIAIGLTMWVGTARLIRGQVMVVRELEYVTAARAIGASHFRIITRYILPNIIGPLMVVAASNFAAAILIEAGLSFLGIGIQPPQPSWGLMIKEHYNFLITNQPLAAIIPGLAIMLVVYAFNILGNALRDVMDVREE